jgi:hypothetical protein
VLCVHSARLRSDVAGRAGYRRIMITRRALLAVVLSALLGGCGGPSHNHETPKERASREALRVNEEYEEDTLARRRGE